MTMQVPRGYRFSTPAQWDACLFDRVDRGAFAAHDDVRPVAPYEQIGQLYAARGAHAPVGTRAGEILWHDDAGCQHRLTDCSDAPEVHAAPYAVAHALRVVSTSSGLWVVGQSQTTLERYEEDTLTRLSVVNIADARVIDLATDGYDSLFVLVELAGAVQALRIDCAGQVVEKVSLEGIAEAKAFVFLRRSKRFVVLADACPRLYWFAREGGKALTSIVIGAMHPCFSAGPLGGDGRDRVLLAGTDGATLGGKPFVLIFDGDGASMGEIPLDERDAPVTGVAGTRDSLLVTGPRGLLRYSIAKVIPDGTAEVSCSLMTPVLHSPDREDARRWLRIEATANLPDGASLEISYAATADEPVRKRLTAIAADKAIPAGQRLQKLLREPGIWGAPIVFHGGQAPPSNQSAAPQSAALSAPLFDVQEPYVWVCITLNATAGGSLPSLSRLAVLYPGQSLMENLPAIYRRAEAQPGSFLRSLVGVLESTTQGLDARIASLASYVHPATSTGPWIDFIARWLGLPWDDALSEDQKKCIVAHGSDLARGRGTRAGLETLLDCLLPGTPRRFRIIDSTADTGFATVGGDACRGSALPAILGGSTQWKSELGASTVLGRMRLPCAGQVDDGVRHIAGVVRIDLAATGEERRGWESWLPALINEMVPLTARVQLRWVSTQALRGAQLDGSWVLQPTPTPHLGSDAVTGVARLPERGSRITSTGADIGTRLQ
jgi:phage tail-like protein